MKILVISAAFPPMQAAEADHTFHLCQHLAARGLEVHLLTGKRSIDAGSFDLPIYPVMRDWSWWDLPRMARFIKRCSPDAVVLLYIGWIYHHHPMITFLPSLCKMLLPRITVVIQFENAIGAFPEHGSLCSRMIRKGIALWVGADGLDYRFGTLLRDSDRIIVLSDHHRATLSEFSSAVNHKCELIPPSPLMLMAKGNSDSVRQLGRKKLGIEPAHFLLVYLGYIYPGKGIETLLRALKILSSSRSNVLLVVVGGILESFSSYAEKMAELSRQLGLEDKVVWTGEYLWDSDEASVYLHAADACVIPMEIGVQLNNSSVAAAAAHGLPIITTRGTIVEQPFVDQENVLLCPPKDPEALATAMRRVIDSPELREHLRIGALSLAQKWFSWKTAIDRMIAILKSTEES